jgi:hypothetical protein
VEWNDKLSQEEKRISSSNTGHPPLLACRNAPHSARSGKTRAVAHAGSKSPLAFAGKAVGDYQFRENITRFSGLKNLRP